MLITSNMNLGDLAERMGAEATESDARAMRDILVDRFDGQDTSEISESVWLEMLDESVNG